MKSKKLQGISALLLATLFYGFFGVISRIIGYEIPLYYQTASRSLFTVIITFGIIYQMNGWQTVKTKDYVWIILRSIAGMIAIIAIFVAFNSMSIGTTYFIFYAGSTAAGYFLGNILFKEKLNTIKIVSLILSFIGLLLIYSVDIPVNKSFYALLSLIAGIMTAVWNTFSKKISGQYSPLQLTCLDNGVGAAFAFIISLAAQEAWTIPTFSQPWLANLVYSFFMIATGYLVVYGFKRIEAQIGSLIMLAEVLFGLMLGFLVYRETISITTVFGGLIILSAIILPEIISLPKKHIQRI